eukprot:gene14007-biopygen23103
MAPEILRGGSSNEKCDVYSYGVILYELVVLRRPWDECRYQHQVTHAVVNDGKRLPLPGDLNADIGKLIKSCWEEDFQMRPSFRDILKTLDEFSELAPSPSALERWRAGAN